MQILTWLTPEDEMYCAATPRAGCDTAIADRPADMPQGRYNRESGSGNGPTRSPDRKTSAWAKPSGYGTRPRQGI